MQRLISENEQFLNLMKCSLSEPRLTKYMKEGGRFAQSFGAMLLEY